MTRIEKSVTSGSTGNIATEYDNDGKTVIVSPHLSGNTGYCRLWISATNNKWYITLVNPSTGETMPNANVNLRYYVIKLI